MDALSEREQEVLVLLSVGLNNRDIGSKLGISDGTIKAHISHIFEKLGVCDRTQAVVVAIRGGLVHLD